ncbi:hypothetical protein RFI_20527, partial [Reticulomyxa filosa]
MISPNYFLKKKSAEENESEGSESGSSEDSSGSSDSGSYSSDDDVTHVERHFKRKQKEKEKEKERERERGGDVNKHDGGLDSKRNSRSKGVFKFDEIELWEETDLDAERGEMFKELAKLMANAATSNLVPTQD